MSTVHSKASVPTRSGSRYLQQLCKHWSHNLQVELAPSWGSVVFPKMMRGTGFPDEGIVTFRAGEDALEISIQASAPDQLETLKGVVASHLDRFAFREAPLEIRWEDDQEPSGF